MTGVQWPRLILGEPFFMNVCTSSTDNETAILWLIQKGAFVQTKVASDPSLAVLI